MFLFFFEGERERKRKVGGRAGGIGGSGIIPCIYIYVK